ncbi:MAG: hypothetical protein AAF849_05880 [Bacteroidota bacterium]
MEEEYENLERLDRFFDGNLSTESLLAIQHDLEQADFKEDGLFFQAMVEVVKEEGEAKRAKLLEEIDIEKVDTNLRDELLAQSKALETKETEPPQAKIRSLRPMRRILTIAASILIIVVAGIFLYMQNNSSASQLAEENYLSADLPGTMSGGTIAPSDFQAALNAFAVEQDLSVAKSSFEQITTDNPKYAEAQYFLGHINAQNKKFEAAIDNYQAALSSGNLPNYINLDKLNWNLLLAGLGAGEDISVALNQLIENANPPIDKMAKALKEKI